MGEDLSRRLFLVVAAGVTLGMFALPATLADDPPGEVG